MSSLWRVLADPPEGVDRRGQMPFFSGGEGWQRVNTDELADRARQECTHGKVNAAIVHNYSSPVRRKVSRPR